MNKIRVVLDAGHSKLVKGKMSFDGSYKEYEFNIDVVNRIKKHLIRNGVDAVYIDYENANATTELKELIKEINKSGGNICISVHSNAYGTKLNKANGWEIYCYKNTGESKKLAEAIHSESIPFLELTDRGIKDGSKLAVVRDTKMPCVLIETAFHTNESDLEKLKSNEFREKCSIAYSKGILNYLGLKWVDEITENKLYKVQVGAFGIKENAEALEKELKKNGYSTIIVEV